ncbi:hypothetical protein B6K69_10630 [Fuscovulum blasticum]|nr:hypothetical protein B6K69_10630 [Fuscovulum blasticum]
MMTNKRSLIRAASVLAVALAAGHLVQTMTAGSPSRAEPTPAIAVLPTAVTPVQASIDAAAPIPQKPDPLSQAAPACADRLTLAATPGAMITVMIHSPCRGGERVVLRHAGLAVAEALDADGRLAVPLPAFDAGGKVSVLLSDGTVLRDAVPVPDLGGLRRFAVQWVAGDAFQLHVGPGVAANLPALASLGDPSLDLPMQAQVYTWPASQRISPVVEAAITPATCGRDLLGETLLLTEGTTTLTDLTLSMPPCDAVGDILVLNNLVPDVTLAAVN